MKIKIAIAMFLGMLCSSTAWAWLGTRAVNNTTPSGGFLLDNLAGFVTTPYPGKIFAR